MEVSVLLTLRLSHRIGRYQAKLQALPGHPPVKTSEAKQVFIYQSLLLLFLLLSFSRPGFFV